MPGRAEAGQGIAVVVPAYQAAATIGDVVRRTRRAVPAGVVYVVDDGSADPTGAEAARAGATVLAHPRNRGKGAALAQGIQRALVGGARIIVTIDADGQHPPEDIARLAAPVAEGLADLVLGARARAGPMPWSRRCSNWVSAALASRVGRVSIADAQTGFRAFSHRVAETVRPDESRYDFESAFLLAALVAGYRVRSVPVATIYADAASHFRSWVDTWRLVRVFSRYGRHILFGAQ